MPTPTPTRIATSFAMEAETHFQAGNLDAAIASYQQAIRSTRRTAACMPNLARILTYSTESHTTDKEKQERLEQAMAAAKQATELSPDDSTAFAVHAFTLDWYASFLSVHPPEDRRAPRNC